MPFTFQAGTLLPATMIRLASRTACSAKLGRCARATTLIGLLLLSLSPRAKAQEPAGDEPPTEEEATGESAPLSPPELTQFVEANVAEDALPKEGEVAVTLRLTISAEGSVEEAEIVQPAGEPFDSAAATAARKFQFRPARQGDTPIPARIQYRYVFSPPAPEPEAEPPPSSRIIILVRSKEDVAIDQADVSLVPRTTDDGDSPDDASSAADPTSTEPTSSVPAGAIERKGVTDEQGEIVFEDLVPGTYEVRVSKDAYAPFALRETVPAGEELTLTYRLTAEDAAVSDDDIYGATAFVDPPPREVTRRTIRREELTRVAGTRGDALRTIELLPGVARPPAGIGQLIIRGSSPQDSLTYLDGSPIPLLYHFGGVTSFMNSRLLDRIDFYPGNFSVRYGRLTGGIVEVGARDPATDGLHGVADINVIDASILAEFPMGDNASMAVAARRSYIDTFFSALVPEDIGVIAAPVYWDYQGFVTYRPTPRDRFRFKAYGSSDELRLLFSDPADSDPALRGNLETRFWFLRFDAAWEHQYSDRVTQDIRLSVGPENIRFLLGENADFKNRQNIINARPEWRIRFSEQLQLTAGFDLFFTDFDIEFVGINPGQQEGNPAGIGGDQALSNQNRTFIDAREFVSRPAAYVELDWQPVPSLTVIPGVRVDYYSFLQDFAVDPRLATIWSVGPQTRLKAGIGLFNQAPEGNELSEELGNPDLKPMRALHTSVGVEQDFTDNISFGVEGFYKYLWDRIVQVENLELPRFTNDGRGRIYGLEVSGRIQPKGGLFGFLSYTLSRSFRNDRGEPTRLFDFDQTHVLNAAAGYRFKRGWELSGTFRLATGNPNTPIIGSVYNTDSDLYVAVFGPTNSGRDALFHRLDVRVEKQWAFQYWKLALYLDIQNVYNRQNQEGIAYSFDFSESDTVSGLPIIPSLGIRGEL